MQADLKKIYGGGATGVPVGGLALLSNQYYDDIDISGDRFLKCGLVETDESKFDTSLFKTRMPKYQAYANKNFATEDKMLGSGLKTNVPVELAGSLYTIHQNKVVKITNIFNFTYTVVSEIPDGYNFSSRLYVANGDLILLGNASVTGAVGVFVVNTITGSLTIIGVTPQPKSSISNVFVGDISGGHLIVALAGMSNNATFHRSTKSAGVYGSFDTIGTISDATTGGSITGIESGRLPSKTNCYVFVNTVSKVYNVTPSGVTTDTTTRPLSGDTVFSQFANRWLTYSGVGSCFYSADANITSAFTATATDMFNIASVGIHAVGFSYSGSTVDIRRLNADGSVPSQQTLSASCQIDANTGTNSREGNLQVIHDATGNNTYLLAGAGLTNFGSILHSSTGLGGFSCKAAINKSANLGILKSGADYFVVSKIGGSVASDSLSYFMVTSDFINFDFKYQQYLGASSATQLVNISACDDGTSIIAARGLFNSATATIKLSAINKTTKIVSADVDSGVPQFDISKIDFICGKYVLFNSINTPVRTATALNSWSLFSGYNFLVKNGVSGYAVSGDKLYSTTDLTSFSLIHTFPSSVSFFDIKNGRAFVLLANGSVLTSTNFTTWVAVELSTSGTLSSVDYLGGMYVASVGSEYEYSTDGINFDAGMKPYVYSDGLLPYDSNLMAGSFGKFAGGTVAFSQGSGDQYMRIS